MSRARTAIAARAGRLLLSELDHPASRRPVPPTARPPCSPAPPEPSHWTERVELERDIELERRGRFTATIQGGSPRAEQWSKVFGTLCVPILAPEPILAELPGLGPRLVLLVDVAELTGEQVEAVVAELGAQFGIPPHELWPALLGDEGLPILVDGLTVVDGVVREAP